MPGQLSAPLPPVGNPSPQRCLASLRFAATCTRGREQGREVGRTWATERGPGRCRRPNAPGVHTADPSSEPVGRASTDRERREALPRVLIGHVYHGMDNVRHVRIREARVEWQRYGALVTVEGDGEVMRGPVVLA